MWVINCTIPHQVQSSCYAMLCYAFMLCYFKLCYAMSCCVRLGYVMSCCVVLYYVMLLCYVMLCCSQCSYSYIEHITQHMHTEHAVKCKYPGADICSSFVLVMAGFYNFMLCVRRIFGFLY